ncbi:MAG: S8 family peptidase [Chloroflexi bacterium]|nr:S8 family peptidase [Chloroflexota bacterium]
MTRRPKARTSSWTSLRALVALLFVLSLTIGVIPAQTVDAASGPHNGKIHPQLDREIDKDPNATVRVIVQGRNPSGGLGDKIARKGGKNQKPLGIAKAVAAEIPAAKLRDLAKDPDVNYVSIDARMVPTEYSSEWWSEYGGVDARRLATDYPRAVGADKAWTTRISGSDSYNTGAGVGVAVVDSGVGVGLKDFSRRVSKSIGFNASNTRVDDEQGHGTHVAGIIAGSGAESEGRYIGIAPRAKLINVRVSDKQGMSYISDVIKGLQWIGQNASTYNIRVVNLSLTSIVPESYLTSPLDAAIEQLWLSGIVVVVSAGNNGPDSMLYPPANDPFVITVGAADTVGTASTTDDVLPFWSGYGTTQDRFSKPEVVAPGRHIVSVLASDDSTLARMFPDRVVDDHYLWLSGTSMSAAVVSGVVALAAQAHPNWTPDQIKAAVMSTARPLPLAKLGTGSGEIDAYALATRRDAPGYANSGIPLNRYIALLSGVTTYNSATWNSATWNSATWNSATWNSATWNSATWNSATWNSATWNSATWNSATWNSATWNSAYPE